jgi:hypothetical protein
MHTKWFNGAVPLPCCMWQQLGMTHGAVVPDNAAAACGLRQRGTSWHVMQYMPCEWCAGVAAALALLDMPTTAKLPPLEGLFTVDEETGLTGGRP